MWSRGNGQLGLATINNIYKPTKVMENVKQVSCGAYYTLIIKDDGSLYACGQNNYGQLGTGDTNSYLSSPVKVMDNVKYASAGMTHTAILKNDNSLWSVGLNNYGQLGLGDSINRTTPEKIEIETIRSVSISSYATTVLGESLKVYSFGQNSHGQLGNNTTVNEMRPVNINIEAIMLSNEILLKHYPLEPVIVVATCDSMDNLERFAIRSDIPLDTHITFEFSIDQQAWKVFDFEKRQWVDSQQVHNKAMTKLRLSL